MLASSLRVKPSSRCARAAAAAAAPPSWRCHRPHVQLAPQCRRQLLRCRASSEGGDQPPAAPSVSTEFELAIPLSSPQGSQLAAILSSAEGSERLLFDPAIKVYLQELQQERDMEAAMEAEAAADAAAEAEAAADAAAEAEAAAAAAAAAASPKAGEGGSSSEAAEGGEQGSAASSSSSSEQGGYSAADTWDDAALMKRIRALREAERGQVVADIVYLEVARRLLEHSLQLLGNVALLSPSISQPPGSFVSRQKLASRAGLLSAPVTDAVLSYMVSTFEGGDGELMKVASPAATPLSVDRVQAARLYAGLLEFGYFAAALEAACKAAGVAIGEDSAAMIAFADKLPEEQLRTMCAVQSADGWWSAVRHIGCVFGLTPNEDAFDSFGLPYPDLSVTISQIQMEPAANMWEHFNTPGSAAKLAAKQADKLARGWSGADADGALPDADLLAFEFGLFQRLLLEAAVYGAVLFGVERRLEGEYGYTLSARKDREEQAGQPPM